MNLLALVLAAATLSSFIWHILGAILVLLCIFLTVIILMQDSKGSGLTSAFGAGPGGESLLGARMQKDVARWTAIAAGIFSVIVIIMGLLGTYIIRYGTVGAAGAKSPPAAEATETPPKAEEGPLPPSPPSVPPTGGAAAPAPAIPPAGSAAPPTPAPAAGSPVPAPGPGSATPPLPPPAPVPVPSGPETGSEKK